MSELLDTAQRQRLDDVLDTLIPPIRGLPGAGGLGVANFILENAADFVPAIVSGLARLESELQESGITDWAACSDLERREILERLTEQEPAFVPGLVFQTFVGYYQEARVQQALGLEGRPPHPLGYAMEPSNLSLLDPVRDRPKLFRKS